MATINEKFFQDLNNGATWSAGVAFKRSNPLPLDKYSVFASEAEARAYALSNPVAYPGQLIAVVDNDVDQVKVYVLAEVFGIDKDGAENYILDLQEISPELPDITASDDNVIELSAEGQAISASHAKKGPAGGATKGATADASLSTFGESIEFKVPLVTVDEYGHTTALEEKTIAINLPEDKDTTYELKYESLTEGEGDEAVTKKYICLYDGDNQRVSKIDASDFIKDGFLKQVSYDPDSDELMFVWNTDSGIDISTVTLSDMLDPYVAGAKINIDGTTISHEVMDAPLNIQEGSTNERKYLTDIEVDGYGHITGFTVEKEEVVDTNDTYTAGNGIDIVDETDSVHSVSVKLSDEEAHLGFDDSGNLTIDISDKVDRDFDVIPVIDKASGSTIAESDFTLNKYYYLRNGEQDIATANNKDFVLAVEYSADTVYYTQLTEIDDDGEETLVTESIEKTLLTLEEREKLANLVFDEDGGVSVSGNVHISQVQGLNNYLTEAHFSNSVVEKLNYITEVDDKHFTVKENKLIFTPTTGRLLTAEDEVKINFIQNIDTLTFAITDVETDEVDEDGALTTIPNVLQLKAVPAAALTNALGDLTTIKAYDEEATAGAYTVVDTLNEIHKILTWGFMDQQ